VTELARAADLAIVIPTRERWEILSRTLDALGVDQAPGFETIVVVDGTDQDVPSELYERPALRVLAQEHQGPGVARNLGAAATERPLLMFLGDDMVPAPELVSRHLRRHEREPATNVAVLGRVEWHPDVARSRIQRWLEWSSSLFDYRALTDSAGEDVGFGRFYSCNVSLKRELFSAAGGFDPDFRFDYEDLDFGWRLSRHDLRLVYEPDAVARHLHRYDWTDVERRYDSRGHAERLMLSKHEWFTPWFYERFKAHAAQPPTSRLWPLLVDLIPERAQPLRGWVEARADRWYHHRLAPIFFAAWESNAVRPANQGRC
jgi:GT2 family glycosyltransferase